MALLLDKKSLTIIKAEKEKGKTYTEIATFLNDCGYRHHSGAELTEKTLSMFCVKSGYRIAKPRVYRNKSVKEIDADGVALLRKLHYDKQLSMLKIAKKLTKMGYTTSKGKKINTTLIYNLLGKNKPKLVTATYTAPTSGYYSVGSSITMEAKRAETSLFEYIKAMPLDKETKLKLLGVLI